MKSCNEMIGMLRNVAKEHMPVGSRVLLYGSRARGEAHANSDWDILVLINKPSVTQADFAMFAYPFVELGWKNDEDVSPQLYTTAEWNARKNTPYYENVEHDKQLIYES